MQLCTARKWAKGLVQLKIHRPKINDMSISHLLAVVLVCLIILKPHPVSNSQWISTFIGDLIIIGDITVSFFVLKRVRLNYGELRIMFVMILTLIVISCGVVLSLIVNSRSDFMGGVFNVARFLYYLLLIPVASYILGRATLNFIFRLFDILFFIVTSIVIAQLYPVPFVTDTVHLVYGTNKLRSLVTMSPRIYGTFMNPNFFAVFVVFMVGFHLFLGLAGKRLSYPGAVFRIVISLFLLFFSGSRMGFVGLVTMLLISVLFSRSAVYFSVVVFCLVLVIVFFFLLPSLGIKSIGLTARRFSTMFDLIKASDILEEESLGGRIREWGRSKELIESAPLFGYGDSSTVDNGFVALIHRFGIVGAVFFFFFFLYSIWIGFRRHLSEGRNLNQTNILFISFSAALLVMSLAAELFFATQVFSLWLLSLILVLREPLELDFVEGLRK